MLKVVLMVFLYELLELVAYPSFIIFNAHYAIFGWLPVRSVDKRDSRC